MDELRCRIENEWSVVSDDDGGHDNDDDADVSPPVLRPRHTIGVVGDTITLPCTSRVNNESRWDLYSNDGLKLTNIYNGNRFLADLKRDMTTNFSSCSLKACPLSIKSVQFEHAGYYVCFESSSPDR